MYKIFSYIEKKKSFHIKYCWFNNLKIYKRNIPFFNNSYILTNEFFSNEKYNIISERRDYKKKSWNQIIENLIKLIKFLIKDKNIGTFIKDKNLKV